MAEPLADLDPERVVEASRAAIEELLASDARVSKRLALVPTVIELAVSDPGAPPLTLMLDAAPVAVLTGRGAPVSEVRVTLSAGQLDAVWTGGLPLAVAMLRGEVTYEGPVRKLLRVVPILRQIGPRYSELLAHPDWAPSEEAGGDR